jgi:hypothetical protein
VRTPRGGSDGILQHTTGTSVEEQAISFILLKDVRTYLFFVVVHEGCLGLQAGATGTSIGATTSGFAPVSKES